jgi:hypothetical protein
VLTPIGISLPLGRLGTPLALEHLKVRFYSYDLAMEGDASFKYLGELGVRKDQTLGSLKQALQQWQGRSEGHVRVSEKMGKCPPSF